MALKNTRSFFLYSMIFFSFQIQCMNYVKDLSLTISSFIKEHPTLTAIACINTIIGCYILKNFIYKEKNKSKKNIVPDLIIPHSKIASLLNSQIMSNWKSVRVDYMTYRHHILKSD